VTVYWKLGSIQNPRADGSGNFVQAFLDKTGAGEVDRVEVADAEISSTILYDSSRIRTTALAKQGDLDSLDFFAWQNFGAITGIPGVEPERPQPFCSLRASAALGFAELTSASSRLMSWVLGNLTW
jgi:hypothetical protein